MDIANVNNLTPSQLFVYTYGNLGIYNTISPQLGTLSLDGLSNIGNVATEPTNPQNLDSGYISGLFQSANFKTGVSGWQLTPTSAEINVSTALHSLDIPDTTTANSFHVDTSGNVWWGATTLAGSTAKVLNTGAGTFSNLTVTGGSLSIGASPNLFVTDTSGNSYWGITTGATIDSYSETNQDSTLLLGVGGNGTAAGQSFTSSSQNTLTSCKWYLKKSGTISGSAYAYIYAHTGTYGTSSNPTGAILATSDAYNVSGLTTSYQLITFNFSGANQITLNSGTYYVVVIEFTGGSAGNNVNVGRDASSPTHSGNATYYSGSWATQSGWDFPFYVYGNQQNASILNTGSATFSNIILRNSVNLSGLVAGTELAIQGWQLNSVFSSTDLDTVSWTAGTLRFLDGTSFAIGAGNTGNMAALTYIYFDKAVSQTALQTTTTAATAVGTNKVLVAVAQNNTNGATFQVFDGSGGIGLDGASINNNSITSSKSTLALRGWTQTCAFSITDADTVAWGAGTFTASDGTSYSIGAGNTGNMSAKTYIYLDIAVSTTAYQTTTTATTAIGDGKVLVAIAQNNTTEATFMLLNNNSYNIDAANIVTGSITANEIAASTITGAKIAATTITAANIAANTITANEIAANTITAAQIAATTITANEIAANTITSNKMNISSLSSISANIGSITAGNMTIDTSGYIKGGQTDYDTGTGFFLGYSGAAYKFSIGVNTGNKLTWDGTTLTMIGKIAAVAGSSLLESANTERTTTNSAYTLVKDITVRRAGTYTVKFDMKGLRNSGGDPQFVYGRIYVNGVAVGTERSIDTGSAQGGGPAYGYYTYSEDISGISQGDSIQLYYKGSGGALAPTCYVRNFQLYVLDTDKTTVNTD